MNLRPRSWRSSSYVSPSIGLNGLRAPRFLLEEKPLTAQAAMSAIRSIGSSVLAARLSKFEYSKSSASFWSALIGSLKVIGIEILDRSLPI